MQYYGDNKATKYTTKLPKMMELEGDWEVGLVEIACPGKLVNMKKRQCGIRVESTRSSRIAHYFTLREGQYRDINDILRATNDALVLPSAGTDRPVYLAHLRYDDTEERVEIRVKMGYRVKFNPELARRLGFSSTEHYAGRVKGSSTPEPDGINVKSLYVYCDLLESVTVGDVKVPLLRIVNVDEKRKEYSNIHRIMKRVMFLPVQKKHFDTVEIQILDDTGNVVPFEDGKSYVVLEFRRATHPYFLRKE